MEEEEKEQELFSTIEIDEKDYREIPWRLIRSLVAIAGIIGLFIFLATR